jgi:hypothetical protein
MKPSDLARSRRSGGFVASGALETFDRAETDGRDAGSARGEDQRPVKTGDRFSARAAAASRTSSLAQQAANEASISAS